MSTVTNEETSYSQDIVHQETSPRLHIRLRHTSIMKYIKHKNFKFNHIL